MRRCPSAGSGAAALCLVIEWVPVAAAVVADVVVAAGAGQVRAGLMRNGRAEAGWES